MLQLVNDMLRERSLLLRSGKVMNAPLISEPSLTKNSSSEHGFTMHRSKKCIQWWVGVKVHIRVIAELGLVHTVRDTESHIDDLI